MSIPRIIPDFPWRNGIYAVRASEKRGISDAVMEIQSDHFQGREQFPGADGNSFQ